MIDKMSMIWIHEDTRDVLTAMKQNNESYDALIKRLIISYEDFRNIRNTTQK